MRKFFRSATIAAMVAGTMIAGAAHADVRWYVTGTFNDGATLAGWFDVNQYANLSAGDVVTTGGTAFTGEDYTPPGLSTSSDTTKAGFFENSYQDGLVLYFTSDITVPATYNVLLTTSFECRSYCPTPAADFPASYRYLTAGYASTDPISTPEPANWAMMILGFGIAGSMVRRAKRSPQLFAGEDISGQPPTYTNLGIGRGCGVMRSDRSNITSST